MKLKQNTIFRKNLDVDLQNESNSLDSFKKNYEGKQITDHTNPDFAYSNQVQVEQQTDSHKQNISTEEKNEVSRFSKYLNQIYKNDSPDSDGSIRIRPVSIYKIRKTRPILIPRREQDPPTRRALLQKCTWKLHSRGQRVLGLLQSEPHESFQTQGSRFCAATRVLRRPPGHRLLEEPQGMRSVHVHRPETFEVLHGPGLRGLKVLESDCDQVCQARLLKCETVRGPSLFDTESVL